MKRQNKDSPVPFYKIITAVDKDKPWMTMVHGASQHSAVFSAQIHFFQQHYHLLLIDLPGHGKSSSMPGPFGLHEYAASILAAMDDAGVIETHYWGTHTGTGAGLLLASKYPKRFHSLVLEGVVLPGMDVRSIADTVGRAKATARDCGVAIARKEWFETADWFAVMRDHPEQCRAAEQWRIISEFSGAPWLDPGMAQPVSPIVDYAAISMPVLLINGQYDLPDFLQMADHLAADLSDVRQEMIPGAGGFPLWEFPDLVNECVLRFLEKV
jgi:pimeloyl-ACP methyl ester carboxylesterase